MRPFLTSLFRKKRTLSLPYSLYSLFVSPLNLSMVFIPFYTVRILFASIFSAFCDLRLMNIVYP